MTQLKLMGKLLLEQATQQHPAINPSYIRNSTNFSYISFKEQYKKSSLRFCEIHECIPCSHSKNVDAIHKE